MDDDGFKTAGNNDGETWDRNSGSIMGTLVGIKHDVGPNRSELYRIKEDGKEEATSVWGSTVLDGRFEEIPMGSIVKIEFLGMKTPKSGGKPYADYEVKYKEPAGTPVEGEDLKEAQDALPDPKDV